MPSTTVSLPRYLRGERSPGHRASTRLPPRSRPRLPFGDIRRRVEDGFDVVAVRIEDERGVVVTAVLRAHTRRPDVGPAVVHCGGVPAHDRTGVACAEGDVRAGGHPVAAGLAADRVQAEVIAVAA